jgi:hypothetical protein
MTLIKKIFSFATLTLLVAIAISSVAAWYSIQGLMAIFAAAVSPIIVMGGSLEFAKVVTTVWLHRYWHRASWVTKAYLIPAVIALALLTSMGIFGFLSKAHSDQSLVSGDVAARVAVYDQKIATANANIDANRKALQQMDAQVDQLLGRTTDDKGANRAVSVRKQQRSERARLNQEIQADQALIAKTNEEAAPVRAEVRKVEAEVGPVKYIAALIYGDNPSGDLLERAVRWVIVLIVLVFDPLALTLMLAAQSSYKWLEEDEKAEKTTETTDLNVFKEALAEAFAPYPDEQLNDDNQLWSEYFEKNDFSKTKTTIKEEDEDVKSIQTDGINLDDEVREVVHEEHPSVSDQPNELLERIEEQALQGNEAIRTEGVTLNQIGDDYVEFKGKSVRKQALAAMHPEMFAARPDSGPNNTNFGSTFPQFSSKGDIFIRVDVLPNRVYKFDGTRWIEINKNLSDSYLYDEAYIKHLVSKIETGEYDIELLSENEKTQIENYLSKNNT